MILKNYPWLPVVLILLAVYYVILNIIKEDNKQKKLNNFSKEKEKKLDNLQKNKKISSYTVTTFLINISAIFLEIKYNLSLVLVTIIISIFLAATNFKGKGKEIIKGLLPILIPGIIFVIYMLFIIGSMKGPILG
jgi:uncharacterized protein YqhQ